MAIRCYAPGLAAAVLWFGAYQWLAHSVGKPLDGRTETIRRVNVTQLTQTIDYDRPPFWPNAALQRYQQEHSVDALRVNPHHRSFALATYWCPDRAGNLLHNFFNSLAWAIITNRTLLVHYTEHDNTQADCERFLKRADWLPTWSEWSTQLQLEKAIPIPMNAGRMRFDMSHPVVIFPQIPDVFTDNPRIFRNSWRNDPLDRKDYREAIMVLPQPLRNTAGMLYYLGTDYLLGMLFRETFAIVGEQSNAPTNDYSIALHSRHPVVGDDGSFTHDETRCLAQILDERPLNQSCTVYLMSDRPKTIDKLRAWVQERHCTVVVAAHVDEEVSGYAGTEHGPWAGSGYLSDLATVAQARSAVIGDPARSSFMLAAELIAYGRTVDAWRRNETSVDDVIACDLPSKQSSGYDYGPSTPIFRHWTMQDPLAPVQVWKEYLQSASTTDRQMVIECSCQCPETLIPFLNGLIWAIISNHQVVLSPKANCQGILEPKAWLQTSNSPPAEPIAEWSMENDSAIVGAPSVPNSMQDLSKGSDTVMSNEQRLVMDRLYSEGSDFLHGMLLVESFDVADNVQQGLPVGRPLLTDPVVSIAVDPAWTKAQEECITSFLISTTNECHVYHSGDSSASLPDGLNSCTLWKANHSGNDSLDAFRDLLLQSKARSATVGALPMARAWIVYSNRLETWKLGRDPPLPRPVKHCI